MGSRTALAILAVLLLGGCADEASRGLPSSSPATSQPPSPQPTYGPGTCTNLLLFQVVDYARTDPYLPPGFHPRDPQAFLDSPAAFGQAGVIFMALECGSAASGPLQAAFAGIFIEAPIVEGLEAAPLNFLELVRYTPATEFGGGLLEAGWPVVQANVTVGSQVAALDGTDMQARVSDRDGTVVHVAGTVATTGGGLGNLTRFWHQDATGLAYIEYSGELSPRVGSGVCEARPGTPLSAFVGQPLGVPSTPAPVQPGDPTACLGVNGGEPMTVLLEGLVLTATLHHLPGERAG